MSAHPRSDGVEAERVGPYLIFLFVLLSTATFFDGFDSAMLTLAAPDARATLDISLGEWSVIFAFTRVGVVGSFLFLFFADGFGRRSLMMITIVGFAVFNLLTGLVVDKYEFAFCQFAARMFLTAEYALATVMIGEEFPAQRALRTPRWKLIGGAGGEELYDLSADPGEQAPSAAALPADLRAAWEAFPSRYPPRQVDEAEIDPETRAQLRALGSADED